MRLFCRKSMTEYVEKIKEKWFQVSKASINYYQQMSNQPYPFDKLDSIFCPDYSTNATENVGCIAYNDDMIARDLPITQYR